MIYSLWIKFWAIPVGFFKNPPCCKYCHSNDNSTYYIEFILIQEAIFVNITELPNLPQNLDRQFGINKHLQIEQSKSICLV